MCKPQKYLNASVRCVNVHAFRTCSRLSASPRLYGLGAAVGCQIHGRRRGRLADTAPRCLKLGQAATPRPSPRRGEGTRGAETVQEARGRREAEGRSRARHLRGGRGRAWGRTERGARPAPAPPVLQQQSELRRWSGGATGLREARPRPRAATARTHGRPRPRRRPGLHPHRAGPADTGRAGQLQPGAALRGRPQAVGRGGEGASDPPAGPADAGQEEPRLAAQR